MKTLPRIVHDRYYFHTALRTVKSSAAYYSSINMGLDLKVVIVGVLALTIAIGGGMIYLSSQHSDAAADNPAPTLGPNESVVDATSIPAGWYFFGGIGIIALGLLVFVLRGRR